MILESKFEKFQKIGNFDKTEMSITQKIHGTNAQIFIEENGNIHAGSRTRWLSIDDDNHGFYKFVNENIVELCEALGVGRHFGEWAGPGINGGEGLKEKAFVLFDWRKNDTQKVFTMPQLRIVPLLYNGRLDLTQIDITMNDLKLRGSGLVSGYMKPEGIVIHLKNAYHDSFFKKTFEQEDIPWAKGKERISREQRDKIDFSHLLQPLRLEKLLGREESYRRDFPKSMSMIVNSYFDDLVEEKQITGDEDYILAVKKALSRNLYNFVKQFI